MLTLKCMFLVDALCTYLLSDILVNVTTYVYMHVLQTPIIRCVSLHMCTSV